MCSLICEYAILLRYIQKIERRINIAYDWELYYSGRIHFIVICGNVIWQSRVAFIYVELPCSCSIRNLSHTIQTEINYFRLWVQVHYSLATVNIKWNCIFWCRRLCVYVERWVNDSNWILDNVKLESGVNIQANIVFFIFFTSSEEM